MQFHNDDIIKELKILKINLIYQAISELSTIMIKVVGDSMLPTINSGEKLIVESVNCIKDLHVNDLIFFYDYNNILALHRLIKLDDETLVLKGDNCDNKDVINFNQVIGKVSKKNKIDKLIYKNYTKETDKYLLLLQVEKSEVASLKLYYKGVDNENCS